MHASTHAAAGTRRRAWACWEEPTHCGKGAGEPWAARWPAEGDVAGMDQVAVYPGWDLKFEPQRVSRYGGILEQACPREI